MSNYISLKFLLFHFLFHSLESRNVLTKTIFLNLRDEDILDGGKCDIIEINRNIIYSF